MSLFLSCEQTDFRNNLRIWFLFCHYHRTNLITIFLKIDSISLIVFC